MFADVNLSKRLERAEGHACMEYARTKARVLPQSGTEWMEFAGAFAAFDGKDSPVTQSFGLGLFEELSSASLDTIEKFFFDRGAAADHEVSPFVGVAALDLLCQRKYVPFEISNVLYRPVEIPGGTGEPAIRVKVVGAEEGALWADVNARGWSHEHPEYLDFLRQSGAIATTRPDSTCFLAEVDSQPAAAGALSLHEGVALLAGAATLPTFRGRGLQGALLDARMRYAYERGCDLLMMVSAAGSNSQRNAERKGFRIAYTRVKWRLAHPESKA